MAASASDKARKSYSYLQKTLNGAIDDNDTTLTLNNTTNVPTDTAVSFVVDRVDSNGDRTNTLRELMTGVVSGSTITNLTRGEQSTTAQSHADGAVVEFVNSGEMWNDMIDFMLQDHSNPSGYHKNLSDANGNEWIKQTATASAVNEVTVANAATGNAPNISATGDDTNIDLKLTPKGTGRVVVNGAGIPTRNIVATSETTTSTTYAALATAQATTVTVGSSGMLLVGIKSTLQNSTLGAEAHMSFALSSANTLAADDARDIMFIAPVNGYYVRAGNTFLLTGLTAGSTVVTAQFRVSANTGTFSQRDLWAMPI